MNIENNSFKEYKKEIIVAVIILGITYLIDLITGYPFKDLFSNYISAFILFILFSFVLFIFKEKKFIIIIWIVFIISISLHSYYIYISNEKIKIPEINFYGLYSNEKQFIVPFEIIEKVVELIISGDIVGYRYDEKNEELILISEKTSHF